MKARPEFTVIAGSNGDLLAMNLRKEHPEWEERSLYRTSDVQRTIMSGFKEAYHLKDT